MTIPSASLRLIAGIFDEVERFLDESGQPLTPAQLDVLLEARDRMAEQVIL